MIKRMDKRGDLAFQVSMIVLAGLVILIGFLVYSSVTKEGEKFGQIIPDSLQYISSVCNVASGSTTAFNDYYCYQFFRITTDKGERYVTCDYLATSNLTIVENSDLMKDKCNKEIKELRIINLCYEKGAKTFVNEKLCGKWCSAYSPLYTPTFGEDAGKEITLGEDCKKKQ